MPHSVSPFGELTAWYSFLQVGILVVILILVMIKPKTFWICLIIGSIIGQGPRFLGYGFFDEAVLWCVIIGAAIRIVVLQPKRNADAKPTQQRAVFFLWVGYMIISSIIGIVANDDLRILRWVLFYTSFGLLALITYNYEDVFSFPPLKQTLKIIGVTALIYSLTYLATGYVYDIIFGNVGGRTASQFLASGFVWSGTAGAVFPLLLTVPAAIIIMNEVRSILGKVCAFLIVFISALIGHFYDSRMAFLILTGCILTTITKLKVRYLVGILVVFSITFSIYNEENVLQNATKYFSQLFEASNTLWEKGEKGDVNRKLQFQAGFLRLIDNPITFIVGDGIYSHRFTLIPHIERLYSLYLPLKEMGLPHGYKEDGDYEMVDHGDNWGSMTLFRTTGFSALLVDTGTVGIVLFALNYIFTGLIIVKQNSKYKLMLLYILALGFEWLFVNNVVDVTILYLLIIPKGILDRLSEMTEAEKLKVLR